MRSRWGKFAVAQLLMWCDVWVGSRFGFMRGCLIVLSMSVLIALGAFAARHEGSTEVAK